MRVLSPIDLGATILEGRVGRRQIGLSRVLKPLQSLNRHDPEGPWHITCRRDPARRGPSAFSPARARGPRIRRDPRILGRSPLRQATPAGEPKNGPCESPAPPLGRPPRRRRGVLSRAHRSPRCSSSPPSGCCSGAGCCSRRSPRPLPPSTRPRPSCRCRCRPIARTKRPRKHPEILPFPPLRLAKSVAESDEECVGAVAPPPASRSFPGETHTATGAAFFRHTRDPAPPGSRVQETDHDSFPSEVAALGRRPGRARHAHRQRILQHRRGPGRRHRRAHGPLRGPRSRRRVRRGDGLVRQDRPGRQGPRDRQGAPAALDPEPEEHRDQPQRLGHRVRRPLRRFLPRRARRDSLPQRLRLRGEGQLHLRLHGPGAGGTPASGPPALDACGPAELPQRCRREGDRVHAALRRRQGDLQLRGRRRLRALRRLGRQERVRPLRRAHRPRLRGERRPDRRADRRARRPPEAGPHRGHDPAGRAHREQRLRRGLLGLREPVQLRLLVARWERSTT